MKRRRGQTTLFIILGVLLLLSVVLYVVMNYVLKEKSEQQSKKELETTAENLPIKAFVDSCVTQTAKVALFLFGFVGGGVTPEAYEMSFAYDGRYKIPYLYREGKAVFLTSSFVENTLERYVDSKLQKCTGDFSGFPDAHVIGEKPRTKAQVLENEVFFTVTYPLTVERGEKKSMLGPAFSTHVPLRMKEILLLANEIVALKQQDQDLIHWDYLTEITRKGYNVTAYAEVNSTIVYRLVDNNYELLGEPYVFQFAVKIK